MTNKKKPVQPFKIILSWGFQHGGKDMMEQEAAMTLQLLLCMLDMLCFYAEGVKTTCGLSTWRVDSAVGAWLLPLHVLRVWLKENHASFYTSSFIALLPKGWENVGKNLHLSQNLHAQHKKRQIISCLTSSINTRRDGQGIWDFAEANLSFYPICKTLLIALGYMQRLGMAVCLRTQKI